MGPGFRHDGALGLTLDAIVTDGGRRAQAFVDVAFFEDVSRAVRVLGPDAGKQSAWSSRRTERALLSSSDARSRFWLTLSAIPSRFCT